MFLACFRAPATRVIISIVVIVSVWIVQRRRNQPFKKGGGGGALEGGKKKKQDASALQGWQQLLPVLVRAAAAPQWAIGEIVWLPPRLAALPLHFSGSIAAAATSAAAAVPSSTSSGQPAHDEQQPQAQQQQQQQRQRQRWADLISDATLLFDDMRCGVEHDMATFAQYIRTCPYLRHPDGTAPRMAVLAAKDVPSLAALGAGAQPFTHVAANDGTCVFFAVQRAVVVACVLRRNVEGAGTRGADGISSSSSSNARGNASLPATFCDALFTSDAFIKEAVLELLCAVQPSPAPQAPPCFGKGFVTVSSSPLRIDLRCSNDLIVASLTATQLTLCDPFTGSTSTIGKNDVLQALAEGAPRPAAETEKALARLVADRVVAAATPSRPSASAAALFQSVQVSLASFDAIESSTSSAAGSQERSESPTTASTTGSSILTSKRPSFESVTYTNNPMGVRFGMQTGGLVREAQLHEDAVVIYTPAVPAALDTSSSASSTIQVTIELVGALPQTWEHTPPAALESTMTALDLLKHNVAFAFASLDDHHHFHRFVSSMLHVTDLNGWQAVYFEDQREDAHCRTYVVPISSAGGGAQPRGQTRALFVIRWECPCSAWQLHLPAMRHFIDNLTLSYPSSLQ